MTPGNKLLLNLADRAVLKLLKRGRRIRREAQVRVTRGSVICEARFFTDSGWECTGSIQRLIDADLVGVVRGDEGESEAILTPQGKKYRYKRPKGPQETSYDREQE